MQQDDAFDNVLLRRTRTEADRQTANSALSSSVVQKNAFLKKNRKTFFNFFSPFSPSSSRSSEFLKTFKGSRLCSTIKQYLNATSFGGYDKVGSQNVRKTVKSKDHKVERS